MPLKQNLTKSDVYKYAVKQVEYSDSFDGVDVSINKPHGLRNVLSDILKELVKGSKRFDPLKKKLSKKYSLPDFDAAIEIMLNGGIVSIESKNTRPNKGYFWVPQIVSLTEQALSEIAPTQSKEDFSIKLASDIHKILGSYNGFLVDIINSALETKKIVDISGNVIVDSKAEKKFCSILLTLAHSVRLQKEDCYENLRVLSSKIWGESKILDRYKKEIIQVAGCSLHKLRITTLQETTQLYGNVHYEVNGINCSFMAGYPVIISDLTAKRLKIVSSDINSIFIVENYAVFQELLHRKYFHTPNVLLFWGEGYLSARKQQLLARLLEKKQTTVYVWGDIDRDGIQITYEIKRLANKFNCDCIPVLMSAKELELGKGEFIGATNLLLEDEGILDTFGDVVDLVKSGKTMEQEELMEFYELIKYKLP